MTRLDTLDAAVSLGMAAVFRKADFWKRCINQDIFLIGIRAAFTQFLAPIPDAAVTKAFTE